MARFASHHPSAGRLWLALRFPDLPAQALSVAIDSPEPLVITEKKRLAWINAAAEAAGINKTMDAITAQLLGADIQHARDRRREQQRLAELAKAMYQFSPYIETYSSEHIPQSGLLLEISSCLMLFGGAHSLSRAIAQSIFQRNLTLATGLAHTNTAAWLLSFENYAIDGTETKTDFIARLKHLPISLLHDFPTQVDALEKTGFVTLGDIARQIAAQSISSFKKRYGHEFADYLSELFDTVQDFQQSLLFKKPLTVFKPTDFFSEYLQFDYPLYQLDQLQKPMETLLQKLAAYLRKRQRHTRHIEWVLSDIYRNQDILQVYVDAPQNHGSLLLDLSLIQLDNRDLPFEIDMLTLNCRNTMAIQPRNQTLDLEPSRKINRQNFWNTAAKLKARLGDASVYKLSYRDGYIPSETNQPIALTEQCQQLLPAIHQRAQRPTWLLTPPAAIEARQHGLYWRGLITLIAGPERIQGNWWREPSARDYFVGLRQDQQRLWVFLDLHQQQWFVHGIFA